MNVLKNRHRYSKKHWKTDATGAVSVPEPGEAPRRKPKRPVKPTPVFHPRGKIAEEVRQRKRDYERRLRELYSEALHEILDQVHAHRKRLDRVEYAMPQQQGISIQLAGISASGGDDFVRKL